MKVTSTPFLIHFTLLFFFGNMLLAQNIVRGEITDDTGEPLISATALIKGTSEGTITDFDGSFSFTTSANPPFTMVFSYIGYADAEVLVESIVEPLKIQLSENSVTIATIEVKGRRIGERQRQSALTVETLDNIAIKETPAASFYDGLGALKDVDLTAASLGFKIINTRGFNSTSPVRSLQLIDGVDNQSPGLNFSLGNFLGSSELDVNRVNLIVGASSAFYGPNAFNGVISMETKDPFFHKGLSAMVKGAERSLFEGAFRYADVFGKNNGIGFKLNFSYFQANDWLADNYDPVDDTDTGIDNPGGYDAVNIYGDELLTGSTYGRSFPGLGTVHRRGYLESDVVDYDSDNLKLGGAVHFRLKPEIDLGSPTLILASNYSTGTTVYQGDNRFSLRDIQFYQHRLELKKHDTYFLRFYVTHEDAGNSYDPYFTSLQLQENAKENEDWQNAYSSYWVNNIEPQIEAIEGYPNALDFIGNPTGFAAAIDGFLASSAVAPFLSQWHAEAQEAALKGDIIVGAQDFYEPGTERFQEEFDRITSTNLNSENGGTRFYDRSALAHAQGEYKFNDLVSSGKITDLDLLVGASYRSFMPNSQGSILLDTMGRNIDNSEFGVYGGGTMEVSNKLKINGSIRFDKNQNFDLLISPAGSFVYSPSDVTTIRASFSAAVRNPTLSDQYLNYNVGRAILLGNLNGFDDLVTVESLGDALDSQNADTLVYFDIAPIRPEKVRTIEVGYRTTLFEKLYVDATYYYSFYRDFIGYNIGVDLDFQTAPFFPTAVQAYRVAANANEEVTTQGFSVGTNYYFANYFVFNANYSWNKLNTVSDDPIIPAFNTPEHKYNLGVSGRNIPMNLGFGGIKDFGFSINYKWVDGFIFEGSPQFTGLIPAYDLLDAQINTTINKINTTLKIGASNILNNETFQTYGGPRIGRLAYISLLYEFKKK